MEIKFINIRFLTRKRLAMTIMKTFIFLMCTTVFCFTPDNSFSQEKVIIEKNQLATVDQVFKIIKKQTDFDFIYPRRLFKNSPKVKLNRGEVTVSELLEQSLSSNNISFELAEDNTILIVEKPIINEVKKVQQKVTGIVTDNNGQPLPGVNVIVKGTTTGTTTDINGNYEITANEGDVLVFSYVGFETKEFTVTSGDSTLNITLQEGGVSLTEVVISANKREQTVMETPMAVQAIGANKLKELGMRDLSEVINLVPGATESISGSIGERQYQIRGIPAITGDATIGYYLDEASYNFYGGFYAPVSRSFDMNRIEVLRGPQSTLYGGGAMGGVIKFVPNKPNSFKFQGEVAAGGNIVSGGDPGYFGDLMLNLPIIKEKLALRFSGSYEEVGGFIETEDGANENIDGGNLSQYRMLLRYQPIEALKIDLTYQGSNMDQFVGNFLTSADPPETTAGVNDRLRTKQDWFIGTLSYDFKNFATLTTTTSHLGNAPGSNQTFDIIGLGLLTFDLDEKTTALNHETRLVSNTDSPFKWLAGFFYNDNETETELIYSIPDFNSSTFRTSRAYSFFGEASYDFNDKLTALVGLRSYNDDRTLDNRDGQPVLEDTFTSINPRFNISYRPTDKSNHYINIAKGFRSGIFNNPAFIQFHLDDGLPAEVAVDSDELWSFEIGTKQQWAEDQIIFEAAAYYQIWNDMQATLPNPTTGFFQSYGVGDTVIPGVDVGFTYSPANYTGFSFQVAGNVNGAQFKDINPLLVAPLGSDNGDRIQYVPAWTLNFNANYEFNVGNKGWKGNSLLAFSHADKQKGFGDGVNEVYGDPQTLLRARLGFQNEKFRVALFGNNLLDESGAMYKQETTAFLSLTRGRPRTFGLEVGYKF